MDKSELVSEREPYAETGNLLATIRDLRAAADAMAGLWGEIAALGLVKVYQLKRGASEGGGL